ncbi:phosphatidate cytidylyltransferase [Desulfonatronospira thiodismutans ASO3-1]|uniref:Phosphatidate cytidylyltransferase n=1 Tax=Desulfonatronospira thiodismutans ASO3-1 TaxID=555779 RepID=D6SPJ9_9BACT|nr:phosphatidate cytidylyltransferase [Desulfonatronospira thiodismutans]EFI34675.1 phosphatidate cytidylyltransferase [Desulfonatronospira thiodismutans ASO3-1]
MPDPQKHDMHGRHDSGFLPLRRELMRKSLHVLALVIPAAMLLLGKPPSIVIFGGLAFLGIVLDIIRAGKAPLNYWIVNFFGSLMRPREKELPQGRVVVNGATWAMLSAFLLVLFFPVQVAAFAFTIFMLGDAAAALAGRRMGRIRLGKSPKTLEGSLAFLATALLISLVFPGIYFWHGAASSLAACIAEAAPLPLDDNLRVPLVAALTMLAVQHL